MKTTPGGTAAEVALINLRFHQSEVWKTDVHFRAKIVVHKNDGLRTVLEKAVRKLVSKERSKRMKAGGLEVEDEDVAVESALKSIKRVTCFDCDPDMICDLFEFIDHPEGTLAQLNSRSTPIFDAGLDVYLPTKKHVHSTSNTMRMRSKNSKRRKIASNATPQVTIICPLHDLLPVGILKEVAKFLEPPSRILFAIAITPPSSPYNIMMVRSRPNMSGSSIAGDDWHTLDFGDIEEELAAKLSDADISKALVHIDAANKVKRLRLTNCVNITGSGLLPLRGSTSIEQIDLSLVGAHEIPKLYPVPPLSWDLVLPILDSIISQERNSLKHLQFTHHWRNNYRYDSRFLDFLRRYNTMFVSRNTNSCDKCSQHNVMDDLSLGWMTHHGVQYTCSICTTMICSNCAGLDFCTTCERCYCSQCEVMNQCSYCQLSHCVECMSENECDSPSCSVTSCNSCYSENKCFNCKQNWCFDCNNCKYCEFCERACCDECCGEENVNNNGVHECERCLKSLCGGCRISGCLQGSISCESCVKMVSPFLLEDTKRKRDKIKSLKEENEVFQDDIKELKDDIRVLKDEVADLMGKLSRIRVSSQTE